MSSQRRLERITTASSLVGLALGFLILGGLILFKKGDEVVPIVGGVVGIVLGAIFLMSAFSFWRYETLKS